MKSIIQFKSIDFFYTTRLFAKKIDANDLEKFMVMNSDPDIMAMLGGVRSNDQSRQDLENHLRLWKENGFGGWIFYLKDTNEWIGRAGLRRLIVAENEEVEMGYALKPCFWNQGFATEIATAITEVAFEVIRLNSIVCFSEKSNKRSQQVMQKAGFQYERDFEYKGVQHLLYRMKTPRKVEIVSYDAKWPEYFKEESHKLKKILGDHLREIYHMGSTAIPGMPAKPVIDIMLVFKNLDAIDAISQKLNTLGYQNLRRSVVPHRSFFIRRQEEKISFHLHIRERGDPQINRHINFKDYIIAHPADAKRYAELKINLAEQFVDDINAYVFGKDKLVQEIDAKAKRWSKRKKDYLSANTGYNVNKWSTEKLIKAMEANLNVQMTHYSQYLNQVELIRIPGFTIVNTGLPDDIFNYVLEADFSSSEANKKIKEITENFRNKKVSFSWWVSPYDKPEDLSSHLENNGYINTENLVAMFFDLDTCEDIFSKPTDLQIIKVTDQKSLLDFAAVFSNDTVSSKKYFKWIASVLNEDDPIEYYIGYVNGEPVVRGLSCYFAQVAGLYWLSTALHTRGKDYDKAMQKYQLKRAKELGYHVAVLQVLQQDYSTYEKAGYKACGKFKIYKLEVKVALNIAAKAHCLD